MLGNVLDFEHRGYSVVFNCENGKSKISFLKNEIVRVQMTPFEEITKESLYQRRKNEKGEK